jgi:hypothetical protein
MYLKWHENIIMIPYFCNQKYAYRESAFGFIVVLLKLRNSQWYYIFEKMGLTRIK